MKKILFSFVVLMIVFSLAMVCFGNKYGESTYTKRLFSESAGFYLRINTDLNDVNYCVIQGFHGSALKVRIDPNGTDPNRNLIFAIDPPETNDTEVHKLYTFATITVNTSVDYSDYVFTIADTNGNPYGGWVDNGDIYVCVRDTTVITGPNDTNSINDLLIYGTVVNK